MIDLGTLGGLNSEIDRKGVNEIGQVVGYSDTTTPDPNGEDYCGFGTYICLPFFWQHGVMTPLLPTTFGGNNGVANAINNRGQVVGDAEFSTPDPTCAPYFGLQIGAALWENGKIKNLPLPSGDTEDTEAFALAINDNGQAVGGSSTCVSDTHALLWKDGKVIDLGNLGGTAFYGTGINNQGQVTAISHMPNNTDYQGYLWQNGKITPIGTLDGGTTGAAVQLNNLGQVVGWSCIDSACSDTAGVLWQNGVLTDLNTLIPPDSPWYIWDSRAINDEGQIDAEGWSPSTGDYHALLLTPTTRHWALSERPKVVLPENIRKQLQQRLRIGGPRSRWGQPDRLPGPGTGPTN